ncbi:MAG: DUF2292 domain-containing protein, partial [Phycisphaerae bacterium]
PVPQCGLPPARELHKNSVLLYYKALVGKAEVIMVAGTSSRHDDQKPRSGDVNSPATAATRLNQIQSSRYGQVNLIVQDGVVVLIEKTEKLRLQ